MDVKRFIKPAGWLAGGLIPPLLMFAFRGLSDPFWALEIAWIVAVASGWAVQHPDAVRDYRAWLSEPRKIWRFEIRPLDIAVELAVLGIVALAAYTVLPKAAVGQRPMDHDHAVHFYKAWNLWENFLSQGRLNGWSHQWFAGYPAQYLYPIGTDLMVVAIKVLSFGAISLNAAYGFAFFLFYVLKGFGAYMLGRVSVGRVAGVIAALIYIGDKGSFRFGGFVYTAEWGVWPQGLSIALALLGLAAMRGVIFETRWRPVAVSGVLLGAALLTHPMQILHLALTAPVLILAMALSDEVQGHRLRAALRIALTYAIAGLIGALWVVTFMSVADTAESYGQPWRTLYDMGVQLHDSQLLEGSWRFWVGASVVGCAGMLFSRKILPSFLGFMTLLLLAASSDWVLAEFHFIELSEKFWFVQWQRFSMLVKPYMMIAAGAAFFGAFRLIAGRLNPDDMTWRSTVVRVFVVVVITAPMIYGFAYRFRTGQLIHDLTEESHRPYRMARDKFVKIANKQWGEKDVPFYRIALAVGRHDHSFADLGARVQAPLYKPGFTPAAVFKFKMESRSLRMYEALNVRYVLSTSSLSESNFDLIEDLGQGLKYYEFKRWKPDPFEVIDGEGDVQLVSWADEEIVLEAAEGATGRLRLNVSNFPRWQVTRDGKRLDIEPLALSSDKERTGFMTFELAPGTYRIVFVKGAPEYIGLILFLLGLLLVLSLVVLDLEKPSPVRAVATRLNALLARVDTFEINQQERLAIAAFISVVAVALGAVGLALWTPGLTPKSSDANYTSIEFDVTEQLHKAQVRRISGSRRSTCPFVLGKYLCGFEEYKQVFSTLVEIDDEWRHCTWAHPLENRTINIEFDAIPAGKKLIGWYGIAQTGKSNKPSPVDFVVGVDGVAALETTTKRDDTIEEFVVDTSKHAQGEKMRLTFDIKAKNIGRRHFCFQAQVVE